MSRLYRALEKAAKERSAGEFSPDSLESEPPFSKRTVRGSGIEAEKGNAVIHLRDSIPGTLPMNPFALEQFRKLKTVIFRRTPPVQILLVTSAAPREGKTTVAFTLAMAISREIQKETIFIDTDLRKPSIFIKGRLHQKGLSDYLANSTAVSEIEIRSGAANLTVVPAGQASSQAAELINSQKMKELLHNFREGGEKPYVILDSPPVLSASEPLILSEWVDGVILVIKAGEIPRGAIRRVVDSLGRQKIIGVVFNQMDLRPGKDYSCYGSYGR